MLADNLAILPDDDPVGIGMNVDGTANGAGQNRVFVGVKAHKARLRHRRRHGMEAVKATRIDNQLGPFFLKAIPNRSVGQFRMAVGFGICNALIQKPAIEFIVALHPQPWREEPLAHQTDLVLNLPFLPTRRWGASRGLHQIMPAHCGWRMPEPCLWAKRRLNCLS